MENHVDDNVGNSDSSMLPYFDEIYDMFPNAKYILIKRNTNEVVESLVGFQLMDDYEKAERWINKLQKQINNIESNYDLLTISYQDLEDINKCKEIWKYLLPDLPFNEKRWHLLDELYVNIIIGKSYLRMKPESLFEKFSSRPKK